MELVLRDPFGRVQRISLPFYFTNQLLHEGLHEYNYSAGFERKNFGVESNTYDRFVFSGFHRYGLTDYLTIGGTIEGRSDVVAFGGQGSLLIPRVGMMTALGGASLGGEGKSGVAGSAAYTYQSINFNARLAVRGFSPGYTTVAGNPGKNRIRYDTSAVVGYATKKLGSISLGCIYSAPEKGVQKTITATYARNIANNVTFSTNFSYGGQNKYESKVLAGITWNFAANTAFSARVEESRQSRAEVAEVRKNAPIGEGYGYNALVKHNADTNQTLTMDTSFQYNGQYGKYVGEYTRLESGNDYQDNYRLNVAGSVLLLGGRIGFSRPVNDSFALVKVGNLEGVKVSQYAQAMGTTNSHGELFVPDLGSFNDNLVTIKAGNIPLDYSLKTLELAISPPYRSGSCVIFPVRKLQPVTGILKAKVGGQVKPLEFAEMTVDTDAGKVIIPTGFGGEFYWEEGAKKSSSQKVEYGCSAISESIAPAIKPGRYHGTALLENKTYRFKFDIPKSDAMIVEVGEIIAEIIAKKAEEKPLEEKKAPERGGGLTPPIGTSIWLSPAPLSYPDKNRNNM